MGKCKNRFGLFAILFLITSLITVPFSSSPAFAKHIDPAGEELENYEGYEPIRFYTIYASYYKECGDFEDRKIQFFNQVSHQYLRMSGFLPNTSNPYTCIDVQGKLEFDRFSGENTRTYGLTLDEAFEQAKDWHYGLLIIIFDSELSRQYFQETYDPETNTRWGGHITYGKKEIVSTSTLETIEEPEGAWILSHELAHFSLNYLYANQRDIYTGYVHTVHEQYRSCQKNNFQYDYCPDTYSTIKAYTGNFKVLAPYYNPPEPPVVRTSLPSTPEPEPTCASGYVLKNGICVKSQPPTITPPPAYPQPTSKLDTYIVWNTPTRPSNNDWWVYDYGESVKFSGQLYAISSNGYKIPVSGAEIRVYDENNLSGSSYFPLIGKDLTNQDGLFSFYWTAKEHTGMAGYEGDKSFWTPIAQFSGNSDYLTGIQEGSQFLVKNNPKTIEPTPKIFEPQSSENTINRNFYAELNQYSTLHQELLEKLDQYKSQANAKNYEGYDAKSLIKTIDERIESLQDEIRNDPNVEVAYNLYEDGVSKKAFEMLGQEFKKLQQLEDEINDVSSIIQKAVSLEEEFHFYQNKQSEKIPKTVSPTNSAKKDSNVVNTFQKNLLQTDLDNIKNSLDEIQKKIDASYNSIKNAENSYKSSEAKSHITKAWKEYNQSWNTFQTIKGWADELPAKYSDLLQKQGTDQKKYYESLRQEFGSFEKEHLEGFEKQLEYVSQELEYANNVEKQKTCFLFWCW